MGNFALSGSQLLASAEGGHPHVSFLGFGVYLAITLVVLFALLASARGGIQPGVFKKPMTRMFEHLYLFIENMCVGVIGSHGRKYVPFIATLWMVIFVSNGVALFMPEAPTAMLGFNLGLALISIAYVQYEGMRANGVFGHLSHFAGPKLGLALIPISIMLFAIEVVSELMKNVSLSLRLYGNIYGGHQAVNAMNALGENSYIAMGAFLLPVKLLTVIVQALIFTLLTCVYISLVTHHDHGDDHGHDEAHGEHEVKEDLHAAPVAV